MIRLETTTEKEKISEESGGGGGGWVWDNATRYVSHSHDWHPSVSEDYGVAL